MRRTARGRSAPLNEFGRTYAWPSRRWAGHRMARPASTASLGWMIAVLGIWLRASPFLFGSSLLRRIPWGDLVAGLVLVVSGTWGTIAGGTRRGV